MLVKDLVKLLNKCNPDAIVMFDIENSLENDGIDTAVIDHDTAFSIDDIIFIKGEEGFVYLTEELCTQG